MAGIGDAWGTREELLHPRDKGGRFRSKWKMAEGVVDKLTSFLSGFRPRTFQSDQQAAQYNQNLGGKKRFSLSELSRLHADFGPAQEDLRDGTIDDPSTKKFVQMMDSHAIDLPDDVIVSRVVGPDAFGRTPETMNAPEGGLEDFTGKKIADRGYSPVNLGTPLGGGSGQITMSIAVPKGTKATIPGQGGNDRTMYLQRSQSYRVTKVKPDGRGGYYMLAVAEDDGLEAPEPIGGHVGAGKPSNREGAVRDLQRSQAERMKAEGEQPSTVPTPAGDGGQSQTDNTPQAQPTLPDGTQPRTEPVAAESIGGGPAPTAPARTDETPAAPSATVPETPAAPAGAPLEDADVAKLRQRRDARARYQAIADRVPQGNAGAELAELVSKKADNKTIADHIRAYANGPSMDEVHKDQKDRVRAELEKVAIAFEQDKPTLGKQRMTKYLDMSNIELVGGPREGRLTHREQGAGKVVDFDEKYMESAGDIPENGKVQVIRPAVVYHPNGTGPNAVENEVVLEKAVVGIPVKRGAKKASAPAVKKAAPVKAAKPNAAEDATVSVLLEKIGEKNPALREQMLKDMSPENRKLVEEAQVRHSARMEGIAAKKAAPAKKVTPAAAPGEITDKSTVADLKKIAADRGVDIKGLRLKKDIRDRIEGKSAKPEAKAPSDDIDKMTKADLLKHAESVGVDVRQSWTKDKIKDQIRGGGKAEAPKAPATPVKKAAAPAETPKAPVKKAVASKVSAPTFDKLKVMNSRKEVQDSIAGLTKADLRKIIADGDIRGAGTAASKEQLQRLVVQWTVGRRLDSDAISRPGPSRVPSASTLERKTAGTLAKKAAPSPITEGIEDMSMAELRIHARNVGVSVGGAGTEPRQQILDKLRDKEKAARGTVDVPGAPRSAHTLQTPERKAEFKAAWIKEGIQKDIPAGQQNSELNEIYSRLRTDKDTPDEALDRTEEAIERNKGLIAGLEEGLRAQMPERDREYMKDNLEKLKKGVEAQEKASEFLRKYFSGEEKGAPSTPPAPTPAVTVPKPKREGSPVRTSQVTDMNGRIVKIDRPNADEEIYLPNGGADQGMVHLDSEVGQLWADLYADGREPNSFINKIAKLGDNLGRGRISLQSVVDELKDLHKEASDTGIQARIQHAIDNLDAPPFKLPKLPDDVPGAVENYLKELAKIPTARKTGRIGISHIEESVIDKKLKAIRDFSEGKIRARQLEQELSERNLHESVDGAFKMWSLGERLMSHNFEHYEKDATGKTIVVSEPNPDWPAIQTWLRSQRNRQQN